MSCTNNICVGVAIHCTYSRQVLTVLHSRSVIIRDWFDLQFLVIWRFFRMWALVDGIQVPENMLRCICNNYDIEVSNIASHGTVCNDLKSSNMHLVAMVGHRKGSVRLLYSSQGNTCCSWQISEDTPARWGAPCQMISAPLQHSTKWPQHDDWVSVCILANHAQQET